MTRKLNLTGLKFGRLTVLKESGVSLHGKVLWDCQCDCGKLVQIKGVNLNRGTSKSCGCLGPEQSSTHKLTGTKEYWIWSAMIQRCTNPKNKAYDNYGGRGITVSPDWMKFDNFIKDMGQKPSPSHSIERQDNNKGYSKDNCIWATRTVQNRNTRMRKDNISGVTGVNFHKRNKKYAACIAINGKNKHLGYFDKIEDAQAARKAGEGLYWK